LLEFSLISLLFKKERLRQRAAKQAVKEGTGRRAKVKQAVQSGAALGGEGKDQESNTSHITESEII